MTDKYILHGKEPVPCDDLFKWAEWLKSADRHVKEDEINGVRISTVFLGLDHNLARLLGRGRPHLFETMIFGGEHDMYCERSSTWDQAKINHDRVVKMVRNLKREG